MIVSPTAAQVAFELMLEGGTGHDAYGRLTASSERDTRIASPAGSPIWIMTADGWHAVLAEGKR